MQRVAFGLMAIGFALSVGTFEATAGCAQHETLAQTNSEAQPQGPQQAVTEAQPQGALQALTEAQTHGAQQALSTVPVAITSSTRDSGSGTAQQ